MNTDEPERFEIVIEYQFEDTLDPDSLVHNWFTPFKDWCQSKEANGSPLWRDISKIASADDAVRTAKRKGWMPAPPALHMNEEQDQPEAPALRNWSMNGYIPYNTQLTAEELDTLRCMLLFTEASQREKARREGLCCFSSVRDSLMRQIQEILPGCESYL